jgi:DNA-binding CsgD family transcriptional regulator
MATTGIGESFHPLRGRDHEARQLADLVQATADGRGGVAVISGLPGSGKTRLLTEAAAAARLRGLAVAWASASDSQRMLPLGPLLELVDTELRNDALSGAVSRSCILRRVRATFNAQAASSGLVLVLDDLQWADPATLPAVQILATQLETSPLLWLLAGRREGSFLALERLFARREGGSARTWINLQPLSLSASTALLGDVLGGTPMSDVMTLAEVAIGNPLLLLELAEGLNSEVGFEVADGRARLAAAMPAPQVLEILTRRLSTVHPDGLRLLRTAAVLGNSFLLEELIAALGDSLGETLTALDELLEAGVLISRGERLSFVHEMVRTVVYQRIPAPVRLALHHHIGRSLLERGGSMVFASGHFIQGVSQGDYRALLVLDDLLPDIVATSPESAAHLALRMLALTEPTDPVRPQRTVVTVGALVAAGRLAEAVHLARSSFGSLELSPAQAAQMHLYVSSILFLSGDSADAMAETAEMSAVGVTSDQLRAATESARIRALRIERKFDQAKDAAAQVLAGNGRRDAADHGLMGEALQALSVSAWEEGRLSDAFRMARAATQRMDRAEKPTSWSYPRLHVASMLAAVGEAAEADRMINLTQDQIDRRADTPWSAGPSVVRARLRLAAGQLDEALVNAQVGLTTAYQLGTRAFVPVGLCVQATICLLRGNLEEAEQLVREFATEAIPGRAVSSPWIYTWVEMRVHEALHGALSTIGAFPASYDEHDKQRSLLLEDPAVASWLVRVALAAGDRRRAEAVVAGAAQLAAENREWRFLEAAAAHARALLDGNAVALYESATALRRPWSLASAIEDAAVAFTNGNDPGAAQNHLATTLSIYEKMGAERDAARVRARLRKLGVRRRHWERSERPASGWKSLTPTELSISALCSEGLTNPQIADRLFLSRHTVDFHLRQIFRKLEINSRVALTRLQLRSNDPS